MSAKVGVSMGVRMQGYVQAKINKLTSNNNNNYTTNITTTTTTTNITITNNITLTTQIY